MGGDVREGFVQALGRIERVAESDDVEEGEGAVFELGMDGRKGGVGGRRVPGMGPERGGYGEGVDSASSKVAVSLEKRSRATLDDERAEASWVALRDNSNQLNLRSVERRKKRTKSL